MTLQEISYDEYISELRCEIETAGLFEAVKKRLDEINHVATALAYADCGLVQEKSAEILNLLQLR